YPWPLSPLFRTLILCHPPPTADIPTLSLHDALPIYRPSSASATSSELATSEPTFTRADWPKIMPLGLSRNTRPLAVMLPRIRLGDRKSTRLNSSHVKISYAVFCLKKKKIAKLESIPI